MAQNQIVSTKAMKIRSAEFLKSSTTLSQCPELKMPEYAFIGRSNVGKSSLINMLLGRKNLAKTSGRPGKTKLINHFLINEEWLLADLPGYGYAKVSKSDRAEWTKMIWHYLKERQNLACIFILVDSRHQPQVNDLEMIKKVGAEGLPLAIIRTKADKMKRGKLAETDMALRKALLAFWEELPPLITTSAEKKNGREDLLELIANANVHYSTGGS